MRHKIKAIHLGEHGGVTSIEFADDATALEGSEAANFIHEFEMARLANQASYRQAREEFAKQRNTNGTAVP